MWTAELATKIHKGHKKGTVENEENTRTQRLHLRFSVERLSPTVLQLFALSILPSDEKTQTAKKCAVKNETKAMRFTFVSSVPFCG